ERARVRALPDALTPGRPVRGAGPQLAAAQTEPGPAHRPDPPPERPPRPARARNLPRDRRNPPRMIARAAATAAHRVDRRPSPPPIRSSSREVLDPSLSPERESRFGPRHVAQRGRPEHQPHAGTAKELGDGTSPMTPTTDFARETLQPRTTASTLV